MTNYLQENLQNCMVYRDNKGEHRDYDQIGLRSPKKNANKSNNHLYKQVMNQFQKNRNKYQKILQTSPSYIFDLYTPNLSINSDLLSNQQLMDKQLQRLMKDAWQLDKQLNKMDFENQQKTDMLKVDNIYQFLRSSWTKRIVAENSQQKLQEINRRIGCIKGQIKKVVDKQQKKGNGHTFEEIVKKSTYYLVIQEQRNQLLNEQQSNKKIIESLQKKVKNLTKQNHQMRWDLQLEKQLTQKLENKINKLKYGESKLKRAQTLNDLNQIEQISLQQNQKKNPQYCKQKSILKNQIIYHSKLKQFSIIINSQIINNSDQLQTQRTLSQIQQFLTCPVLQKFKETPDIDSFIKTTKMADQLQNIMAFGRPERVKKIRNRGMFNQQKQIQNSQNIGDSQKSSPKQDISGLVSLDSKKRRFCRSPKVINKI